MGRNGGLRLIEGGNEPRRCRGSLTVFTFFPKMFKCSVPYEICQCWMAYSGLTIHGGLDELLSPGNH